MLKRSATFSCVYINDMQKSYQQKQSVYVCVCGCVLCPMHVAKQ